MFFEAIHFWLLCKNESAGQLGRVPSYGMGENRKGLCQVNRAGGVELPIEAFPGRFCNMWPSVVM